MTLTAYFLFFLLSIPSIAYGRFFVCFPFSLPQPHKGKLPDWLSGSESTIVILLHIGFFCFQSSGEKAFQSCLPEDWKHETPGSELEYASIAWCASELVGFRSVDHSGAWLRKTLCFIVSIIMNERKILGLTLRLDFIQCSLLILGCHTRCCCLTDHVKREHHLSIIA